MSADTESERTGEKESVNLTNFLFGNVNEKWELEDFAGDEEERSAINRLSRCHVDEIDTTVRTMTRSEMAEEERQAADMANKESVPSPAAAEDTIIKPLPEAEDFSTIEEMVDLDAAELQAAAAADLDDATGFQDDDYDDDDGNGGDIEAGNDFGDREAMPPPASTTPLKEQQTHYSAQSSPQVTRPNTPLADRLEAVPSPAPEVDPNYPMRHIMPPEFEGVDIRQIFPDFEPSRTPRWSKLFKASRPLASYSNLPISPPSESEIRYTDSDRELLRRQQITCGPLNLGAMPTIDELATDDCDRLLADTSSEDEGATAAERSRAKRRKRKKKKRRHKEDEDEEGKNRSCKSTKTKASFRHGPAEIWYDMMSLPNNMDILRWNLKSPFAAAKELEEEEEEEEEITSGMNRTINSKLKALREKSSQLPYWMTPFEECEAPTHAPRECLLPINQRDFSEDVIWDVEQSRDAVMERNRQRASYAGWTPHSSIRTMTQFQETYHGTYPGIFPPTNGTNAAANGGAAGAGLDAPNSAVASVSDVTPEGFVSLFPIENYELIFSRWEDKILWDPEVSVPPPCVLTLDVADDNLILEVPVDPESSEHANGLGANALGAAGKEKEKTPRKSRVVLGKAGLLKDTMAEEEEPAEEEISAVATKDRFNLSNDEYYYPRLSTAGPQGAGRVVGVGQTGLLAGPGPLQHSTPAMELKSCYFPTHMGAAKLRHFHRPMLKRYNRGPMSMYNANMSVLNLHKNILKKAKIRDEERAACGGGDIFFMRTAADLTGCDGDLILCEYSEEFPPLMNLIGMATKVKNYVKRSTAKDAPPLPDHRYGEFVYVHQSPFLGQLRPNQCLQALENNMFRAPIFEHKPVPTDFLTIRTRNQLYIRTIRNIYTVGQVLPQMEVPGPNSKKANNFIRDFVQAYIYRLFWRSKDEPRRIKMDDVRRAFPTHSESSMRKRLKLCADFKRTGQDASWWVLRKDFRLASEEELRAMVTPEECAAYYSMTTAEQRLKDAGYGEKYMFTPEGDDDDDDEKDSQVKMEDEVKCAPWNTTHAFLASVRGKCFLDLSGPADPSGIGEAFSYVKLPAKPGALQNKDGTGAGAGPQPKRTVTGTDADLRRLQLQEAKEMCRSFGLDEKDFENLGRWDIVDMVRTVSTRKAKEGEELDLAKFARGNRLSTQEQQDRYKEECQRIFDLQNRVLASEEVLSTDDNSDDSEDSDIEEMGKNIESVLDNKMTSQELVRRREEEERKRLQRAIAAGESLDGKKRGAGGGGAGVGSSALAGGGDAAGGNGASGGPRRLLRISRSFVNEEGKTYTRTEIVRTPGVIDIYLKIRQTKEENFIRQFAGSDEQQKEELRREKRRLQDQLRRLRKMEQAQRRNEENGSGGGGGGGSSGMANRSGSSAPRKKVKKPLTPAQQKMRCGACGQMGHMRTNRECPVYMKTCGKSASRPPKERRAGGGINSSLDLHTSTSNDHLDDSGSHDESKVFVSTTKPPAESSSLPTSMLESGPATNDSRPQLKMTIKRVDTGQPGPSSASSGLGSAKKKQLLGSATKKLSSGSNANVTGLGSDLGGVGEGGSRIKGGRLLSQASNSSEKTADYLQKPRQTAHRRRVDPLVALTSVLEEIFNNIRKMDGAEFFYYPVSEKTAPNYLTVISQPMDLQTIRARLQNHEYTTREEFIRDLKLVRDNSALFNGTSSHLTDSANSMFEQCLKMMMVKEEKLMRLEKAINPLLDEDDFVGFAFILEQAIERMRSVENSWPFHQPVDGKRYKDYYTRILNPMDLKTLEVHVKERRYRTREEFLSDVDLIVNNCIVYNRETSPLTATARKMATACRDCLKEHEETLVSLEMNILSSRTDDAFTCSDSNAGKSATGGLDNSPQPMDTSGVPGGGDVGGWEDDLQLSSEEEADPIGSPAGRNEELEKSVVAAAAAAEPVGDVKMEESDYLSFGMTREEEQAEETAATLNISAAGHTLADDLALSEDDDDEEVDVEDANSTMRMEEEDEETEGEMSPPPMKRCRLYDSDEEATEGEETDGNSGVRFFLGGDDEDSNIAQ